MGLQWCNTSGSWKLQ